MYHYKVAVLTKVEQLFTYTSTTPLIIGSRVVVPFGKRRYLGIIWQDEGPPREGLQYELKPIETCLDDKGFLPKTSRALATFMSEYYFAALGEVLKLMVGPYSQKTQTSVISLNQQGIQELEQRSVIGLKLSEIFAQRPSLTQATYQRKTSKELRQSLKPLITIQKKLRYSHFATHATPVEITPQPVASPFQLNPLQQEALKEILSNRQQPKPILLYGITGSGKTEVYLQTMAALFTEDPAAQALILVPEIALTPQMTKVIASRFPDQVAVVHSAMTPSQKAKALERIRQGYARVLIGPRSALFASFAKLSLIVVDEEHDSSYKQETGVFYHGRDMAVMRAHFENALIILASATPSLESWHNAQLNKYRLIKLQARASGSSLPPVELVAQDDSSFGHVMHSAGSQHDQITMELPEVFIEALKAIKAADEQAIVLINRRGYAHFLFDLLERQPVVCRQCSISMTLHQQDQKLLCHYCGYQISAASLPGAQKRRYASVGFGSQQVEAYLRQLMPELRLERIDADSMNRERLENAITAFSQGKLDVLMGTQMLAKGHDFPRVTLTLLLGIDQALAHADFRAAERVFQLIVQSAGRAGRGQKPGRVLMQARYVEHPVITEALHHDFEAFAHRELSERHRFGHPPWTKMVAIDLSAQQKPKLLEVTRQVNRWLLIDAQRHSRLMDDVSIIGPLTPGAELLRGWFRRKILVSSANRDHLRQWVQRFRHDNQKLLTRLRWHIDVDPQHIF